MPRITPKQFVRGCAFVVLLCGPILFGLIGKPTEAALLMVAGAMALVFSDIERFASFKGAGFEATLREIGTKVEALTERQTEPEPTSEDEEEATPLPDANDAETQAVLDALDHPQYTWRYLSGMRRETKLPEYKIKRRLAWLVSRGYARVAEGKHGTIWSITEDARHRRGMAAFEAAQDQRDTPLALGARKQGANPS